MELYFISMENDRRDKNRKTGRMISSGKRYKARYADRVSVSVLTGSRVVPRREFRPLHGYFGNDISVQGFFNSLRQWANNVFNGYFAFVFAEE